MIKYIEKHRKPIAGIISAITVLISIVLILIFRSPGITVVVSAVAGTILLIQLTLFFMGVPSAVLIAVWLAFMAGGITISAVLKTNIKGLSNDINPNIFSSLIIGVMLFFVIFLRIPARAKERIEKHMNPENADEVSTADLSSDTAVNTYQLLVMIRGANTVSRRPYSLENVSPSQKKLRLILGFSLLGIGVLSLLIGANLEDTAARALQSYVFWICISGLFVASFGAFLMVVGFIRTLISHSVLAGLAVLSGALYFRLIEIQKQSVENFIAIILLIIVLITVVSIGIYRYFKAKNAYANLCVYEKNGDMVACDYALHDLIPIKHYKTLTRLTTTFRFDSMDNIDKMIANITSFTNFKKYIFAGYRLEPPDENVVRFSVYIYSMDDNVNCLTKKLTNLGCRVLNERSKLDPEYTEYLEYLYPDIYALSEIINANLYTALEKDKYDFSEPLPLVYTLFFRNELEAVRCANDAKDNGYNYAKYHSNVEHVEENGLSDEYSHVVYVQNHCVAKREHLNIQSRKIIDFAKNYNGKYHEFELGELTEEDK